MPFSLHRLNKVQLLAVGLIITVAITGWALSKRNRTPNTSAVVLPVMAPPQSTPAVKRVAGVSVNLTRFGFEPSEITIPKGRYFLSVRNLTEQSEVSLILTRSTKEKLIEEPYKKERPSWDKLLNLTPGSYVLTEKSNPNWVLKITVKPN